MREKLQSKFFIYLSFNFNVFILRFLHSLFLLVQSGSGIQTRLLWFSYGLESRPKCYSIEMWSKGDSKRVVPNLGYARKGYIKYFHFLNCFSIQSFFTDSTAQSHQLYPTLNQKICFVVIFIKPTTRLKSAMTRRLRNTGLNPDTVIKLHISKDGILQKFKIFYCF